MSEKVPCTNCHTESLRTPMDRLAALCRRCRRTPDLNLEARGA